VGAAPPGSVPGEPGLGGPAGLAGYGADLAGDEDDTGWTGEGPLGVDPDGQDPGPAHGRGAAHRAPPRRRRRPSPRTTRAALAGLAAAGLVLGGILVVAAFSSGGEDAAATARHTPTPSATSTPTSTPTVQTVTIHSAVYEGRPYTEVRPELADLGLRVVPRYVESDEPAGTVVSVRPDGERSPGDTVHVAVAKSRPTPTATRTAPAPGPSPAPSSSTTSPSSLLDGIFGHGNGHGGNRGKGHKPHD